jgi:hydrogenase maturation protease
MGLRVIGLGQSAAGDDAVGFAVLAQLRQMGVPEGVELLEANDATALMALLETPHRVIVVDAVVGHPRIGEVVELAEGAWPTTLGGLRPLSTHGVSLQQAVDLARVVAAGTTALEIVLVGVAIAPPERYTSGLSPAVKAAVPAAARVVLARAGG